MFLKALIGTLLGFLSGLGVGGGSLLILWLTLVLGMDQMTARSINLLFFLPAAMIAVLYRRKQGVLPIKKILPALIAGTVSAGATSLIGQSISTHLLKKGFGILLLATGFREIFYKPKT